ACEGRRPNSTGWWQHEMSNPQVESRENVSHLVPDAARVGRRTAGSRLAGFQLSPEALRALPADFVKRHRVLPYKIQNGTIHVATAEPGNARVIDDIRLLSGLEVQESETPAAEVLERIAECYQVTVEQMIENLHPER